MKKRNFETRQAPQLSFRAAFEPASYNAEKRTVDLVWTTGARVRRGFWDAFDEELSTDPKHVRMGRLNSGAPLLDSHNAYGTSSVLGVVENARMENGKGVATVRFSQRADIQPLIQDVRDGIIKNVSVGYRVHKFEKVEDGKIPVMRAVDWEPHEISLVAVGADPGAGVRAAEGSSNDCVVLNGCEPKESSKMDEQEKLAAEQKAADEKRQADVKESAERAIKETREAAIRTETERISGIRHAARAGGLGEEFATRLIGNNTSLSDARKLVLDEMVKRTDATEIDGHHTGNVQMGEEDGEKWVRGVTGGILARSGQLNTLASVLAAQRAKDPRHQNIDLLNAFKGFDPADNGGEFRGFTLVDLARESLERKGIKTRGMSTEKLVERALYARDNGGQNTTSDFAVALENVMYKTLLGAYAQQSDSWRRFSGTDSVQDFRPSNRYRMGSFGVLDLMDESGEYKQKQIPDVVKQSITTQTYGNKIALSRKAIVNDDMGAVVASADRFGRMAGLSIEVAVYALLAQNGGLGPNVTYNGITAPLFDAQFANISTTAAFSMTAVDLDRVKMASQVDISNNEKLDLRPNVLLVPLSLGSPAKALNRDAYDPTPGAAFQAPNYVAGLFRDIVDSPRLTGTRRYLFTDQTPALLVAFLNGVQVPVMDQRQGWDIDGIEWKLRLDFEAQGFDPKGAVTNAG